MAIQLAKADTTQLFAADSELLEDWRGTLRTLVMKIGLESKHLKVLHLLERDIIQEVLETLNGLCASGTLF